MLRSTCGPWAAAMTSRRAPSSPRWRSLRPSGRRRAHATPLAAADLGPRLPSPRMPAVGSAGPR
eukprot:8145585-Alexandrium_andersonii.AAC.1